MVGHFLLQRKKDQQTGSPSPHLPSLFRENFRHCPSSLVGIEKSETLAKLFPKPPVVAFRRPKRIKDTLVRAAVFRPSSTIGQCKPCCDKRCRCCLQLQHTLARRQERSIRSFAMSIAKHLMCFTSLTVTSAGRNR
jgi:hypothetical protein